MLNHSIGSMCSIFHFSARLFFVKREKENNDTKTFYDNLVSHLVKEADHLIHLNDCQYSNEISTKSTTNERVIESARAMSKFRQPSLKIFHEIACFLFKPHWKAGKFGTKSLLRYFHCLTIKFHYFFQKLEEKSFFLIKHNP